MLRQSAVRPSRKLRANFTEHIIQQISEHPRQVGRMAHIKEMIQMKLMHKPIMAALAGFVVIAATGTTYAAVSGWPLALFSGQKNLADSGRIVSIDTKNCGGVSAYGTKIESKDHRVYFKIKAGSKLTNEQVTEMVQGNCEINEQTALTTGQIKQELDKNPANKNAVLMGDYVDSTVTAISDAGISLELASPIYGDERNVAQTFRSIDPNVVVYYLGNPPTRLSLKDINVGDHVSIVYRAKEAGLTQTEVAPDQLKTDNQIVVSIIKNPKTITTAVNYQRYFGHEFEPVAPPAN